MRYTVAVQHKSGQIICETPDCTEKEAKKVAKIDAKNYPRPDHLVFVSWFRPSDGQHGYLNPDGNHAITGEAW